MNNFRLSEPSKELAARILAEVGFEQRLVGYNLRERTGPMPVTLYSFEEVVGILYEPHPRIEFNRLKQWISTVMGDRELAQNIKEIVEKEVSDQAKLFQIRDLMGERLLQCKRCQA